MMKFLKIFVLGLFALAISNCSSDDDRLESVNVGLPASVDATINLTQDNSGEVTFVPTAENASSFILDFGDGNQSDTLSVGSRVTHVYAEGNYDATISALNLVGQSADVVKPVVVSFLQPTDLEITAEIDNNNPFLVRLSATAQLANSFEVTFGENEDEEPIAFGNGETVEYLYSTVGEFEIEVTALSGGAETLSGSTTVSIFDPLLLPIDFESETVQYAFSNFGGGEGVGVPIIDNPDPNSVNDSPKVAQYTKVEGSETFAGTAITLNENVNFSTSTSISMDVYSPAPNTPINFKIENAENAEIFVENIQNTTTSGEWETLTFNFSDIDFDETYSTIVLFFDFDTSGNGETYLFDNIELADPFELALPLDFEAGANFYPFTEFEGAPTEVIPNPDVSGINTSANVARTLKANGAATFAGSFIDLAEPIDLTQSSTLKLKVWSPIPNNSIILKLESLNSDAEVEDTQVVQATEEWVEVEFDLSGVDPNETFSRVIFFFDFGENGSGLEFYFDDLEYAN